jgi:membrane dipeptidase
MPDGELRVDSATGETSLHDELLVADLHTHAMLGIGYLGHGLRGAWPRWVERPLLRNFFGLVTPHAARAGGVDLVVFVIYLFPTPWRRYRPGLRKQVRRFEELCRRHADIMVHARSAAEVESARADGKLAVMLALEGGHAIEQNPHDLVWLRRKGLTYLTLSHFIDNKLSGTATHPGRVWGLSRRGRDVVRLCNELGILVDVTHSSARARREAMRLSHQPVIYSHTGLSRFVPVQRMTTDAELRAVARDGGLVGQLLAPYFLNGTLRATTDDVARNVEHMCEVMGPGHVAIGSDFCSGLNPPAPLRSMADYPEITRAMERRGLGRETIGQVWGGSFLRLLRAIGR